MMDRRESLKSMLLGSMAVGLTTQSCLTSTPAEVIDDKIWQYTYGRTPKEAAHDEALLSDCFFEDAENETIKTLANLILPPNEQGTIEQAGVVDFIEFMVKDVPEFQVQIRGGLMWLNNQCNARFNSVFISCTEVQQKEILDKIAYPDPEASEQVQEVQFFSLMRNLVLTGYFTSEVGIKELDYKGNTPNTWDGVPQEVLDDHGLSYDPEWLAKCVDHSKSGELAEWDEEGNLIT
ncbi:gluconate 2-dehydrogenase subunit 3 family protein [Geojedonia litorea]|uniref:Gluconate 2-dehydrogenase subunit 3 family protein n=1 Tax=Geojedonia litorea TaxID=1268269 RepID=A0ABV9N453_9FLAO